MSAPSSTSRPYDVLLFDIEGTTTPISFVKEILFPYVTRTLPTYLKETYDTPQTKEHIRQLAELSEKDAKEGVAGVVVIPLTPPPTISATDFPSHQISLTIENVRWQMSSDRKSTALKALQGSMWLGGYESGELKGQLFGGAEGDVVQWMRKWKEEGLTLAIYSSGSVEAQKLLFRYSDAGDLTPLLSAYFDTRVGLKQEATSYASIAKQLNVAPQRILFLTDIYGESVAARQSQVDTILLVRPGNYDLPEEQVKNHTFPTAQNFEEVQQFIEKKSKQDASTIQNTNASVANTSAEKKAVDTSSGQFNTF